MHSHGTACTRSFCMGLTSARDLKLDSFLMNGKKIFYKYYENEVNLLCSKVVPVFKLTQTLSMSILQSLWTVN
jgi:hypothetical protein